MKVPILAFVLFATCFVCNGSIMPFCTNWNTAIKYICDVAIPKLHNFTVKYFPRALQIRHCNFLFITPHCCEQFCTPVKKATCEQDTGVCRCQGKGTPEMCQIVFNAENPNANKTALDYCEGKCAQGDAECKNSSYVTDGVNFQCLCYCPSDT